MIVDVQNHLLPLSLASDAPDAGIIDTHSSPPMFRWRGISMTVNEEFTDIELHLRVCRDAGRRRCGGATRAKRLANIATKPLQSCIDAVGLPITGEALLMVLSRRGVA